jgi:hypothetical protein
MTRYPLAFLVEPPFATAAEGKMVPKANTRDKDRISGFFITTIRILLIDPIILDQNQDWLLGLV